MWNKKTICALLAAGTALLPCGCASSQEEAIALKPEETAAAEDPKPDVFTLPEGCSASAPQKKNETVTIKAAPNGKAEEVTVETVLSGLEEGQYVKDLSFLSDIRNLEGPEEYCMMGDNAVIWENSGEDIRYKGTSNEAVPVSVTVTCFLDGRQIDPEELAGKSGHVKIRFDYASSAVSRQVIDGISYQMAVPFTAVTMIPLSEHFSNVTAENGKTVRLGENEAVVGCALPGIGDSLRLSSNEITKDAELPEYVELEADVEDFELDFTVTVFTPGLFSGINDEALNDAGDMTSDMNKLSDASGKLKDGASKLYSGMSEFKTYLDEYNAGLAKVGEGAAALRDGLKLLDDYSDDLEEGACELSKGMTQFSEGLASIDLSAMGSDTSSEEAREVMKQVMAAQEDLPVQILAINTSVQTLMSVCSAVSTFYEDAQKTNASLETAYTSLSEGYTPLTEEQKAGILASFEEGSEDYQAVSAALDYYAGIPDLLSSFTLPEIPDYDQETTAQAVTDFNTAVAAFSADLQVISSYLEGVSEQMSGLEKLPELVKNLQTGATALSEGACQLKKGISTYTEGVNAAYEGASQFADGLGALPEASGALSDGYDQILEGTWSLADGMREFDEKGISELAKLGSGQMKDLIRRAKALKAIDAEYTNYAGITEGTEGSVSFMVETEEIKP